MRREREREILLLQVIIVQQSDGPSGESRIFLVSLWGILHTIHTIQTIQTIHMIQTIHRVKVKPVKMSSMWRTEIFRRGHINLILGMNFANRSSLEHFLPMTL